MSSASFSKARVWTMVKFSTGASSAKRLRNDSRSEVESAASCHNNPDSANKRPFNTALIAHSCDLDVLDCPICMEPLSPPIFQCCNGHYICCCCMVKMNSKCPTCLESTGMIRNLGLEKIIESLRLRCKFSLYGCMETLSHKMKGIHEKQCLFAPTECPVNECDFLGPIKDLSFHFSVSHCLQTVEFEFEAWFTVHLALDEQYMLLKSEDSLFLLHNSKEKLGTMAYITSFHECIQEKTYNYCMTVNSGKRRLTMENAAPYCIKFKTEPYTDYFLLIPTKGPLQIDLLFHQP